MPSTLRWVVILMKITLALALSVLMPVCGAALLTRSVIVPWYARPLWLIAYLALRGTPPTPPAARAKTLHAVASAATAWTATMLGVLLAGQPGPDAGKSFVQHPASGQHFVLERTGFPWRGIEGSGYGLGHDYVPFDMGVDALLVNFTCLFAVAWLTLRLVPRAQLAPLARVACLVALVANASGMWHLVALFD
jgi:hypothetical protein